MKYLTILSIALLPACSAPVESAELEDESDPGQTVEALTGRFASDPAGRSYFLGVKEPFGEGTQAPPSLDTTVVSLPRSRNFTLRFSGWSGTNLDTVRLSYSYAQSRISTATNYTYTQVASNAYILVQNSTVSGGVNSVPGFPGTPSVLSFVKISCSMGPPLSEALRGMYALHANQNDACIVKIDTAKVNTFCNFDATCVSRVQRHIAAYSLAHVGGLGRSQASIGLFATQMNVDTTLSKTSILNAQTCLAQSWTDALPGQYFVTDGGNKCSPLFPSGW